MDEATYVDLGDVVDDFDGSFFESGGVNRIRPVVESRAAAGDVHALSNQRVGAPIARPHQILAIGLNYREHIAEAGFEVPTEPVVFTKSPNSICGPFDEVRMPRNAMKLDWELELGVVIGLRVSYLESPEAARDVIAGFTVVNDISERSFQMERSGQWSKGKSAETFNPSGPWLVTPDEIPNVHELGMWLNVNGERRQTGCTSDMLFDPYFLVYYLSQFLVLEPGDLIDTGTPSGVGMGFDPPVWLQVGDVMDLGIERLGQQRLTVVGCR